MRSPRVLLCALWTLFTFTLLTFMLFGGLLLTSTAHAAPSQQEETFLPALMGEGDESSEGAVNVAPELDFDNLVAAVIPLTGGEVVATTANGTRVTLTIPDGALAQTTTVTLTPLAALGGLPGVELVGAVEIGPLDLWLYEAATLKIEPAQPLPVADEYPFAYYGDGQDFHPYPILPYVTEIVLPIGKFDGGFGLARGDAEANVSRAVAPSFTPADPEAQLRAQISALIQAERERVLQGAEPDPTLWPKILDLLMQFYDTSIKPLLQPSMTDCDFAEANMGKAISWLRTTTLIFGEASDPSADSRFAMASEEIMNALIKAMENCYLTAAEPCLDREDPQQVSEVLRYYRSLLLLGAEGNVPAPEDLPECTFVDVQLQNGAFHYEFEKDPESGYDGSVHFQFVDDSVSGFGIYHPYFSPLQQVITPTGYFTITALIDDEWQTLPVTTRFLCRDQRAERVQEVVITFAQTSGGEPLPPQVYADNIGCWRWTGTYQRDLDYNNLGPSVPEYTMKTSGNITLERTETPVYFPFASQGDVTVSLQGYRYVDGSIQYDYRLHHVNDEGGTTCLETLSTTQSDLPAVSDDNFPALQVPNAGFGREREVQGGSGSELDVDVPYQSQGTTCPNDGRRLDVITVDLGGELSADGRSITLDESGRLGEQTGDFVQKVNLQALRE